MARSTENVPCGLKAGSLAPPLVPLLTMALLAASAAGATDVPAPLSVTSLNSMDGKRTDRPKQVLGLDCVAGAQLYAIDKLTILNASPEIPRARRDRSISAQGVVNTAKPGTDGFDVVINGTFFASRLDKPVPLGPVMRDGVMDHDRYPPEADGRGAVAMRADGTVIVGRAIGVGASEIEWRFGDGPGNPVEAAMGGGALLIENGTKILWPDLRDKQRFTGDLTSNQFRPACHSLVGVRDGQAYLIFADGNGAEIQAALAREGFDSVVKFDGGGACSLKDFDLVPPGGEKQHIAEYNPTGLAATLRRRAIGMQRADPCKTPDAALPSDNPMVDGTALSACFNDTQCAGRDAGKLAAEAYCRSRGEAVARTWGVVAGTVLSRGIGNGRIRARGEPVIAGIQCGAGCPDGSTPGPDGRCGPPAATGSLSTDTWAGAWACQSNRWGRLSLKIEGAGAASRILAYQPNAGPFVYRVTAVNPGKTAAEGTFALHQGESGPVIGNGDWTFTVKSRLKALDLEHVRHDRNQKFLHLCERAPGRSEVVPVAPARRDAPVSVPVQAPAPAPAQPAQPPTGTWQPIN